MDKNTKEKIKCKIYPKYFLQNYLYIEEVGNVSQFQPYKAQLDIVDLFLLYHYLIILKSRQIGISTLVQGLAVYLTTFFSNITVGIISRDGPESTDFARKCRMMYESLPAHMRHPFIKKTEQSYELSTNSRIIANPVNLSNPQSIFRGKSLTLLIVDEAAFVRKISEAFTGMTSSMATAHRQAMKKKIPFGTIILSTPNGTTGIGKWFYDTYIKAQTGNSVFKAMRIHYSLAPFADEKWLEDQKSLLLATKGPEAIEQELELKFISSTDALLEKETFNHVQLILQNPIPEIYEKEKKYFNKKGKVVGTGTWRHYDTLDPKEYYLIGVDVAPSYGTCNSAIEITDFDLNQKAEFVGKFRVMDLENEIIYIMNKLPNAFLIVEANSYAAELVERLEDNDDINSRMYFRKKYDDKGKLKSIEPGLLTDTKTKPKMITSLYWTVTNNPNRIKSKYLAAELLGLDKNANSKRLTDRVMALALICYVKDHEPNELPEIIDKNIKKEDHEYFEKIFQDSTDPKSIKQNLIGHKIKQKEITQEEFEQYMFQDIEIYDPSDLIEIKELNNLL